MVYTLALKMLANPAEAEDLTQDVFVNFWQRQKYNPDRGSCRQLPGHLHPLPRH
jgi:RNA polymerase sigma-70 factor, ECF subfamily